MTGRPRLLDLFCGAGGATRGYQLAGFHVTGVDTCPQPRYVGDEFVQADALSILRGMIDYPTFNGEMWRPGYFDAIHASPPCQDHSTLRFGRPSTTHETGWMLTATIECLRRLPVLWVVENVVGARRLMPGAFTLCARSFGIRRLRRHRLFLANVMLMVPPCACGREQPLGVYGDISKSDRADGSIKRGSRRSMRAGLTTAQRLMGIDWMSGPELAQAIPPAYTEFIGEALLGHVRAAPATPTG